MDGQRDCAERECGHYQADPKGGEDPKEALPDVTAHCVSRRTPRDQIPADPKKSVDGYASQFGAVDNHVAISQPAQVACMGIDDAERQDEAQKVQAVPLRLKSDA